MMMIRQQVTLDNRRWQTSHRWWQQMSFSHSWSCVRRFWNNRRGKATTPLTWTPQTVTWWTWTSPASEGRTALMHRWRKEKGNCQPKKDGVVPSCDTAVSFSLIFVLCVCVFCRRAGRKGGVGAGVGRWRSTAFIDSLCDCRSMVK